MTILEIKKALECCHTMAVKCNECPLWERKGDWTDGKDCDDVLHEEILKVWDNMIPIGAVEQIKWERDTAMKQLNEHGIPFCGVADDVVKVVRCKECKYRPHLRDAINEDDAEELKHGYFNGFDLRFPTEGKCPCQVLDDEFYSWIPEDDWFCADGERRDP